MSLRHLIAPLFFLFAAALFATEELMFDPAMLSLGTLQQGEERQVEVVVTNSSKKTIQLIDCIAQGRGPQKITYPSLLAPGAKGLLRFRYSSSELEGEIAEHITLIDRDEKSYPIPISAKVVAPIAVWPGIVDFGWLQEEPQSVVLYLFSPVVPQFHLAYDTRQLDGLFTALITPVQLDISRYPEEVSEVKSKGRSGYKVVLTLDLKKWPTSRKSLGALARFFSSDFPLATPEFYAVGYRK